MSGSFGSPAMNEDLNTVTLQWMIGLGNSRCMLVQDLLSRIIRHTFGAGPETSCASRFTVSDLAFDLLFLALNAWNIEYRIS